MTESIFFSNSSFARAYHLLHFNQITQQVPISAHGFTVHLHPHKPHKLSPPYTIHNQLKVTSPHHHNYLCPKPELTMICNIITSHHQLTINSIQNHFIAVPILQNQICPISIITINHINHKFFTTQALPSPIIKSNPCTHQNPILHTCTGR